MAGRRTWLTAALLVALVAAVLATWRIVGSEPYVAAPPSVSTERVDAAGAAAALGDLVAAVDAGDPGATAELAAPGDDDAATLLAAVVDNAAALRVEDLTMRYVDAVGGVDDDGRWQAAVDVSWRFTGFDEAAADEEVLVGFEAADGQVDITGLGGGDRRTPLWLSGPLEVRRSETSLVLAAASAAEADALSEQADAAVDVVEQVLPQWPGRLVVELPAGEGGLDAALGAEAGTYADIAAVSASVDGTTEPDSQVHVFVNPVVFGALDPIGSQVVISHEATHVATGAPLTTGVPLWLLEGFADFVALRDVDLPLSTTAGQIIAQVQQDGPPDALPAQAEFDQTDTHLGAAYESAWVVCLVLADAGGEDALVRLYEEVSRTGELAAPLQEEFGLTEAELTTLWQQRLTELAGGATGGA